jgi:hypothetical protein
MCGCSIYTILQVPQTKWTKKTNGVYTTTAHGYLPGFYRFQNDADHSTYPMKCVVDYTMFFAHTAQLQPIESEIVYLNTFKIYGNTILGQARNQKWYMVELKSTGYNSTYHYMQPILQQKVGIYKVTKDLHAEDIIIKNPLYKEQQVVFTDFVYKTDNSNDTYQVFGQTLFGHRYLIKTFQYKKFQWFTDDVEFVNNITAGLGSEIYTIDQKIDQNVSQLRTDITQQQLTELNMIKQQLSNFKFYLVITIILVFILTVALVPMVKKFYIIEDDTDQELDSDTEQNGNDNEVDDIPKSDSITILSDNTSNGSLSKSIEILESMDPAQNQNSEEKITEQKKKLKKYKKKSKRNTKPEKQKQKKQIICH